MLVLIDSPILVTASVQPAGAVKLGTPGSPADMTATKKLPAVVAEFHVADTVVVADVFLAVWINVIADTELDNKKNNAGATNKKSKNFNGL